uniref:Cell division protein n=1 Tax=Koliella corcontica TaxID=155904 RepID=A0A097KMS2_9CHLO|nr:cell division protein [Koliella corcontica]AIT94478.1 cell division protein [Koliella corcontica]
MNNFKNFIKKIPFYREFEIYINQNKSNKFYFYTKIKTQVSEKIIYQINDLIKKLNTKKFKDFNQLKLYFYLYIKDYKKGSKNFIFEKLSLFKINYVLFGVISISVGTINLIPTKFKDLTFIYRLNLPSLACKENELSWQTFKFFKFYPNQELLNFINDIKIYDNDIYIEPNLYYHTKNNKYFIGLFKNNKINKNTSIDSKNYKIIAKNVSEGFRDFYYLLDEFPLKLDNDYIKIKKYLNFVKQKNLPKQHTENIKQIDLIKNLKKYRKLKKNKNFKNLDEQKAFQKIKRKNLNFSFFSLTKTGEIKQDNFFKNIKFWFIKVERKLIFIEKNKKNLIFSENKEKIKEISKSLASQAKQAKQEDLDYINRFKKFKEKKYNLDKIYKFYFYKKNINIFNIKTNNNFWQKTKFLINSYNSNSSQKLYKEYKNYNLESLIFILNKNKLLLKNKKNIYLKKISGFKYPDFNIKKVKLFLISNLLNNKNFLYPYPIRINRINYRFLPPAILKNKFLYNKKHPDIDFLYKDITLLDSNNSEIIFEGPAIKLDENFGDVILLNSKITKNWLKSFLNFENPISDKYKTFFGRNKINKKNQFFKTYLNKILESKPIIKNQLELKVYQSETNQIVIKKKTKKGTAKPKKWIKKVKKTSNKPFVPQNKDWRVPFFEKNQWITIIKSISESNNIEEIEIIPFVCISYPRRKPIIWPLMQFEYSNSLNDSKFPLNYILHQPKKYFARNNYFETYSQYRLNNDSYDLRKLGSNTKKISSLYPKYYERNKKKLKTPFNFLFKSSRSTYYQNWEPLTINSWLLITQYCFLRLALDLLKGVYNNYGKEFASYCVDVVADLGASHDFSDIGNEKSLAAKAEAIKENLDLIEKEKSFRIIYKNKVRFRDIIGINKILPELSEFVWYLRALKYQISLSSMNIGVPLPKGMLLIGAPGTGKTLIAKAIAGESGVPVIVQSASSLVDYEKQGGIGGAGLDRLEEVFYRAKQIAPCIIFVDEIDSLGQKRENVIGNRFIGQPVLEAIYDFTPTEEFLETSFDAAKLRSKENIEDLNYETGTLDEEKLYEYFEDRDSVTKQRVDLYNSLYRAKQNTQKKVNLMVKFLLELDGLRSRKGVVVIAATNRPEALDEALMRPGRFDQILEIKLPDKDTRIEILKLYTNKLGITFKTSDSWDYLAKLTKGFSSADIAAIANESALKSIINESLHSLETLEQGIQYIIGYPEEKEKILNKINKWKDPYLLNRFAFYQASKAILQNNLYDHPKVVQITLIPRTLNARFTEIHKSELISKNHSKITLQNRVIGFYAGKAGELLSICSWPIKNNDIFLKKNALKTNKKNYLKFVRSAKSKYWISNLGYDDIYSGTALAYMMIDHWYLYSKNSVSKRFHAIDLPDFEDEYKEMEVIELFKLVSKETERYIADELFMDIDCDAKITEHWKISPWWHVQMLKTLSLNETIYFGDWYRIFLPDPEETDFNLEYVPPDEHFQINNKDDIAEKLKNTISWNDVYSIQRDYIFNGLILNCLNKAFYLLDVNREYLDFMAYYLMKYQIIRQTDLENFNRNFWKKNKKIAKNKKKLNKEFYVDLSWGVNSRRKNFRFLNMDQIFYVLKEKKYIKISYFTKK